MHSLARFSAVTPAATATPDMTDALTFASPCVQCVCVHTCVCYVSICILCVCVNTTYKYLMYVCSMYD